MSSRATKHAGHDAKRFTTSVRSASVAAPAAGIDLGRRRILAVTVAGSTLAMLAAPSLVRAQSGPKIRIGYWPVAAGLPFFVALEKGVAAIRPPRDLQHAQAALIDVSRYLNDAVDRFRKDIM